MQRYNRDISFVLQLHRRVLWPTGRQCGASERICCKMNLSPRLVRIRGLLREAGEPAFRFQQLMHAIYRQHRVKFRDIPSVGQRTVALLEDHMGEDLLSLRALELRRDAGAEKALFQLQKGERIEATCLRFPSHTSICVSSQVRTARADEPSPTSEDLKGLHLMDLCCLCGRTGGVCLQLQFLCNRCVLRTAKELQSSSGCGVERVM